MVGGHRWWSVRKVGEQRLRWVQLVGACANTKEARRNGGCAGVAGGSTVGWGYFMDVGLGAGHVRQVGIVDGSGCWRCGGEGGR